MKAKWKVLVFVSMLGVDCMGDDVIALDMDLRIRPGENQVALIARAENRSSMDVDVEKVFLYGDNDVEIMRLDDKRRERGRYGAPAGMTQATIVVAPGERVQWETTESHLKREFRSVLTYDSVSRKEDFGSYAAFRWHLNGRLSRQQILLGVAGDEGRVRTPVPAEGRTKPELWIGFVYDPNRTLQFVFLCVNGEEEVAEFEKPLTRNSRLVVSAERIGYHRELILRDAPDERVRVKRGEVWELRLPWREVLNVIPQEDMKRVIASGGDLDFVWKAGELESHILALSLADPEGILRAVHKSARQKMDKEPPEPID